ncbi:uncharacterized protein LOC118436986 isoform X3 [Folsomia candida]|uniref:uncharacterized protein LOC118436986 isoform X3 n=1 Tax=Folsomia candida TaxID=158441 RepID=UPI0016050112|nr:uncharacterized protein LOC118436986 isoform X3 [Folsomia candida]
MKQKFDLDLGSDIYLQDDQEAEIDEDVFPILVEQPVTPNIVFFVKGEVVLDPVSPAPSIIYVSSPVGSNTSFRSSSSSSLEGDNFTQQRRKARRFLGKLVEVKGLSPSTTNQKLIAAAIMILLPPYRYSKSADVLANDMFSEESPYPRNAYPQNESRNGNHFYGRGRIRRRGSYNNRRGANYGHNSSRNLSRRPYLGTQNGRDFRNDGARKIYPYNTGSNQTSYRGHNSRGNFNERYFHHTIPDGKKMTANGNSTRKEPEEAVNTAKPVAALRNKSKIDKIRVYWLEMFSSHKQSSNSYQGLDCSRLERGRKW